MELEHKVAVLEVNSSVPFVLYMRCFVSPTYYECYIVIVTIG
jgi:hypothetical protein